MTLRDPQLRKPVTVCLAAALALPLTFPIALYSFALRARLALGYWPSPYHPDPKDLGFDIHYLVVIGSIMVMLLSPLVLLAVVAFRPLSFRERSYVQRVGMPFATLYVLMIVFARSSTMLSWFFD
jgi:hypothetical protein